MSLAAGIWVKSLTGSSRAAALVSVCVYAPTLTPGLGSLLIAATIPMSFSAVLVAAQYSLVQGVGEPPGFLGVFSAGLGAGSVVASLASGRMLRAAGEKWLAVLGMADFALGNLLRATSLLPLAVAGSVVLGFALPWLYLALLSFAQRSTPPDMQGRVSAAVTLAFFGPQAPLQALGALAIRHVPYGSSTWPARPPRWPPRSFTAGPAGARPRPRLTEIKLTELDGLVGFVVGGCG
jgi:MFS family permease